MGASLRKRWSCRAGSSTSSSDNPPKPAHTEIRAFPLDPPREGSRRQGSRARSPLTEQELNAAIVDAVADPIVTVDHRHRIIAMNRAAEAAFGWDRREAEGRELVDL